MTGNKKLIKLSTVLASITPSSFHIEMKKSSRGAVVVVSGVMSVGEYTKNCIEVLSHSGRVIFTGDSIGLSVLEGRVIEIYGKITELRFGYGKS